MSQRRVLERLTALGIVLLVIGLGAGIFLALSSGPHRTVSTTPASISLNTHPVEPISDSDLKVVWEGYDPKRSPTLAAAALQGNTPSPLVVQGIIYSPDEASVAFIKSGSQVMLGRVGDVIDGWNIKAIEPGRVVFDKDGTELALAVGGRKYEASGAIPPALLALDASSPKAMSRAGLGGPSKAGMRAVPPLKPVVAKASLPSAAERAISDAAVGIPTTIADLARNNPASVMEGVKVEPLIVDKQMRGVTIAQVAGNSIAARYGLAPQDRIIAINGEPLDSTSRIYQLYSRYRNSDKVRVTIERAGQVKDVLYFVQ